MQTTTARASYRLAMGLSLASTLILIWLSLGVGIIGRDGDPANLMFCGVLGVGIIGALTARFRSRGMAITLLTMAFTQALIAIGAAVAGLGLPWSGPAEVLLLNALFVAMFASSAWLFHRAASAANESGGS